MIYCWSNHAHVISQPTSLKNFGYIFIGTSNFIEPTVFFLLRMHEEYNDWYLNMEPPCRKNLRHDWKLCTYMNSPSVHAIERERSMYERNCNYSSGNLHSNWPELLRYFLNWSLRSLLTPISWNILWSFDVYSNPHAC